MRFCGGSGRSGGGRRLLALCAAAGFALLVAPAALGADFIVTTTADSGPGSLRTAIQTTNGTVGVPDRILFSLPAGPQVITPLTPLPVITDPVDIDGSSNVDVNGLPLIRIDAGDPAPGLYGLEFNVSSLASSSVRNLVFTRWDLGNGAGLYIHGTGTALVAGSLFGTDAAGTTGLGNYAGVFVQNTSQIGGSTAADRNVASGNVTGIFLGAAATVTGNYVGLNPAGTAAIPNSTQGILVQGGAPAIGGPSAGQANVIAGNNGDGVRVLAPSAGTTIRGNKIGRGPFTDDMGNGGSGVEIFGAGGIAVGGIASVNDGNEIAYNGRGVRIQFASGPATGNAIRGNDIHDNDNLGIDLNGDNVVTPNDAAPDADTGTNNLQNFPVLTSATVTGSLLQVAGTLTSAAGTTYSIDVFTTPTCDGSGNGEGAFYNGRFDVTTDGTGAATFTRNFGFGGAAGQAVTATATDPAGNTSEFSACVTSTADAAPTVALTEPLAGAILRGTVTVSADANDDVGVTSVEFVYSSNGDVSIGTDTTAPYSVSFDSTSVPNTLRAGATVYAKATDTFGSTTTSVGQAVTVDNPPSQVVFETNRDGNSEIYSIDPSGNVATRLTNDPAVDTRPSLSPDGSLIAWERGSEIWLMNSDGTNPHSLTTLEDDHAPAFSPDGTKIAFVRDEAGDAQINDDIWVMNVDGTGAVNLTNAAGRDGSPTWSPDGTRIAFDSDRTGAGDIYTMNANGSSQTLLTGGDAAALDTDPDWSPDGTKIAFVSARGTFTSVWVTNADGSGATLDATNATIFDADPSWAPDGTHIAFVRDSGGQTFNVHTARADGTTPFPPRITFANTTQRNSFPDWGRLFADASQAGPTFTVTSAADTVPDGCTDAGCTLREAIQAANAHPDNPDDPDEIHFAIPGSGLHVISPGIPLPAITGQVTIDGTTQPGFLADPIIFVDGSTTDCGPEVCASDGLRLSDTTGTVVRGLAIGNFSGWGLVVTGGSDNVVESSWIGVDPSVSFVLGAGNASGGILVTASSSNRIGGPTAAQRVVVASNNSAGTGDSAQVVISGASSSANVVQGSYIGLEPDGETSNDTQHGVKITGGASGSTIGGDSSAGEGNVVYGLYGSGVLLESAGADNVVAGNLIGRANDGEVAEAPEIGIDVLDSTSSVVGDDVVPPGFASPVRGNVVLGADTAGIHVDGTSTGTVITGNFIGVDRDGGETTLGNADGVLVSTSNVNVGPGNTISRNSGDGVELELETVQGVRIVANSISDNGGLGINRQTFANGDATAPTLSSATAGSAVTTVNGTVGPGLAGGTYFVEFFSNTTCDPSGAGEGAVYLGFAQVEVSPDGDGSASFSQALPLLPVGTEVTATTTSVTALSTSDFSTCAAVTTGAAESVVELAPEADTFVTGAQTGTNFGTLDYFDTYGGFNASCVPYSAPAYGLLRFDLSSLPAGSISDAKLVLTSRAGYAQDGDPNHFAIRLSNDAWTETGVNWDNRPSDGTVAPGNPTLGGGDGGDIRESDLALGADFVWRNTCGSDFAGNQTKVFPTNSTSTKPLEDARADMIAAIESEAAGDDKLSIEIYNPNCVSCPAGANTAYWARYYSKEAADPSVRPKLVVTYATGLDVTSFTAIPANPVAGVAQVKESEIPPSALFTRDQTTGATPLADTPLADTPLADTPLADTPLGDTPLADTSLGLGDVIAELRTVPLSSLPLLRAGGWPAVLANTVLATRALQNVTLGDALALTPRPAALDGQGTDEIKLEELDLSRSPLGDVAAIAFALGSGVTLGELSGATQLDADLQRWCIATGTSCPTTSVLSLGLRGAPLADTPLGDTPLADTPLADTPLGDTPLADTPLADTPLGDTPLADTPLGDTPLADTPLGDTPLGDTDLSRAPLGDTPLGDTPLGDTPLADTVLTGAPLGDTPLGDTPLADTPLGDTPLGDTPLADTANCSAVYTFTDCATRGGTLDDHRNELRPGVTLAQFVAALTQAARERLTLGDLVASLADPDDFTLAQLLAVLPLPTDYTLAHVVAVITDAAGLTILDLVNSLPNPEDFTLNDLLAAVLRATAEWESVDVDQPEIVRASTGGGSTQLQAALSVSGPSSQLTFTVDLPRGWTTPEPSFPSIESVPPGVTSVLEVLGTAPTADGGTRLTLRTQTAVGGDQLFKLTVRPGTRLGPATPSLVVSAGATSVDAPPTSVDVRETFEPNNDPATAPILTAGTLYLSYITSAADSDFYRFTVPATGTRTTFRLGHLPADYDLVVYGPAGSQLVGGTADPLETPVLGDSGAPITHLSEALPSETLDDLTLLTDRPVLGVSAFRTTEDDTVAVVSDGAPGDYVVQVTGYNGASSVDPYMLRVETEAPRLEPTCVARPAVSFGTAGGVSLTGIPTDADTLFLVNGPQLATLELGGQSVLDWFTTANLNSLRTTGHPSALVRLENDPAVRAAYTAWNAQPCSPARANAVVRSITDVIATIRAARPSVRNVVLLGADRVLPFARLDDLTTVANEADYASTFARTDEPYGALFEHKVLSDDPYGTTQAIPYLQRRLFVPQLAVGRLVEMPAQITGALDRFVAFGGILDPTSARTSGYDFLSNGAAGVAAAFSAITGAQEPGTTPPLIGDLWTRSTLAGALGTTTGLIGMNGHADHRRLQPARDADGDGRFLDTDLFTAADLPSSLTRAVIFSMGCHSGFSASDAAVGAAVATDWAQTFAAKGAAAFAGNLGYGYGDTVTIAYSEALNVRLAQGLRDGLPIGTALVAAKQSYLAGLGLVGVYDEKAMGELALYGLPMWRLAAPAAAAAAQAGGAGAAASLADADAAAEADALAGDPPAGVTRTATDTDPITGLLVDHWQSQPTLTERNVPNPNGGRYWEGPSGVQVTHLRPLQPKVQFDVAGDAHGVLITGLASSDQANVDPVYARPIVDNVAAEPELPFADVVFPAKIQTLVSQQTIDGRAVSAVLVHGQFFSNATADAAGDGTQRLFTRVDADVLRSASTDRLAPQLDNVEAMLLGAQDLVSFSADAVDLPGNVTGDVVRVLVAWRDETSSTWKFLDLAHGAAARWSGTATTTGNRVEFFVQAVDRAGNVAASTNKGLLYIGAPPAPPTGTGVDPTVTPKVGGTQTAGWFTPGAVVDVDADAGVQVSVAVDGGGLQPFTGPIALDSDGLHTVEVHGSNGYEATLFVPVDALAPTVALDQPGTTVPLNAVVPLAFRCADTASGVASCTAKVDGTTRAAGFAVPASPLGSTHTVQLTATDRVGRTATQTFTYTVTARGFVYTSTATGNGDIYSLPVDAIPTTVATRLTATSFPEADPAWSPDSRRIAFAANRDGTWRIYLTDADGTDTTLLATGTGDATEPAWSPDGTKIVFVSTRTGNPDIWVVGVNGTGLTRLTTDTKLDVSPAWAPSSLIAWSNGPGGQLDIWTMNATGGSKKQITKTQDVITDAAWKSDGTIAFARRAKGNNRFELWTMTSTGGSQTRLFAADRNDLQPTWLQDGRIVFATDRDDVRDFDLFRATKSGSRWTQARVTNAPGDERAPNG